MHSDKAEKVDRRQMQCACYKKWKNIILHIILSFMYIRLKISIEYNLYFLMNQVYNKILTHACREFYFLKESKCTKAA